MMNISRICVVLVLCIAGSLATIYFVSSGQQEFKAENSKSVGEKSEIAEIYLGKSKVFAEVVRSAEEITRGLSGRENLLSDHGMLFAFSSPDRYGFWMKEMKFPIDIIWMDENKKIIHLEGSVLPKTYPRVFYPGSPALYVLELTAGFAESHGIGVGTTARF